jgi:NitT/TauT family transport system permease protein
MQDTASSHQIRIPKSRIGRWIKRTDFRNWYLGSLSIAVVLFLWEFAGTLKIPGLQNVPPPSDVIVAAQDLLLSPLYWEGWARSLERIFTGFIIAQIIGIPVGLAMAVSRASHDYVFPVVEMLRPIPPVAWIPLSVVFWPTQHQAVVFIIFLGAFWIVLVNTIGGARQIDQSLKWAAHSLGAGNKDLFWRVILPASIPSIITGAVVGMGIAWEMVVAAEMIAGDTGLGYLLWRSFEFGQMPLVIVCMVSIGVAGALSSMIVRLVAYRFTPWLREQ